MEWVCPYKNLMTIIKEVRQEQQQRLNWLRDHHGDGTRLSPSREGQRQAPRPSSSDARSRYARVI